MCFLPNPRPREGGEKAVAAAEVFNTLLVCRLHTGMCRAKPPSMFTDTPSAFEVVRERDPFVNAMTVGIGWSVISSGERGRGGVGEGDGADWGGGRWGCNCKIP